MSKAAVKKTENVIQDTPEPVSRTTKIDILLGLMRRKEGAGVDVMAQATGWQVHSVRGAIAGQIKKKLGLAVAAAKVDGKTVYRIEA